MRICSTNISHAGWENRKAYENGTPDYAGAVPRSGDASDGILNLGSSAVTDTVADDLSIILSVAQLALYPRG